MALQEPDWNRFGTRYEPPTNRFWERNWPSWTNFAHFELNEGWTIGDEDQPNALQTRLVEKTAMVLREIDEPYRQIKSATKNEEVIEMHNAFANVFTIFAEKFAYIKKKQYFCILQVNK